MNWRRTALAGGTIASLVGVLCVVFMFAGIPSMSKQAPVRWDVSAQRMMKIAFLVRNNESLSGKRLVLSAAIAGTREGVSMEPREFFSPYYAGVIPAAQEYKFTLEELRGLDVSVLTSFAGRVRESGGSANTSEQSVGRRPLLADALHPDGVVVVFDDLTFEFIPCSELDLGVARFGGRASHTLLRNLSNE